MSYIIISLRYHDVHLRALGTDNVTVQRLLTQVDLAALGLVDGHGGNSSQHLEQKDDRSKTDPMLCFHRGKSAITAALQLHEDMDHIRAQPKQSHKVNM